ncbi:helix-turn-helix domain-containing protein [Nonomuraea ferruginea]
MTARELAERLEVSVRTIYRDVDSLHASRHPALRRRRAERRLPVARRLPHQVDRADRRRGRVAVPGRAAGPGGRAGAGRGRGGRPAQADGGAAGGAARPGRAASRSASCWTPRLGIGIRSRSPTCRPWPRPCGTSTRCGSATAAGGRPRRWNSGWSRTGW